MIGDWSLVIGHWSLVIGHWSLVREYIILLFPRVTASPHFPISPRHRVTPSPHHPISPSPRLPAYSLI
ncbi:hypothetical protein [Anabaena lutea]|uniref:hypothetical protein n=1 Tax=Anabaena lutea TaxID=212350 RepID=UPI003BB66A97